MQSLAAASPPAVAWIMACALAEVIGMTLAAAAFGAGAFFETKAGVVGHAVRWLTYGLALAAGAGEGAALGVLQGLVIRRRLPLLPFRRFVAVMVTIGVVGWGVCMLPSTLFATDEVEAAFVPPPDLDPATVLGFATLFGSAGGLVIGMAQALILKAAVRHGLFLWIALSGAGWAIAFVIIFTGASLPSAGSPLMTTLAFGALTGVAAGAVLGAITLPALQRLVAREDVGDGNGG